MATSIHQDPKDLALKLKYPAERLFFCNGMAKDHISFSVFIKANTHDEAIDLALKYWEFDETEDFGSLKEPSITAFQVPESNGILGIISPEDIKTVSEPISFVRITSF